MKLGKRKYRKNRKHNNIVHNLERRLSNKPYVISSETNFEYDKGECDILTQQGNRLVYYEIKCNYSIKGLEHGTDQLLRWTGHMYKHYKGMDYYGVFYTPTEIKIIAKNGKLRK